MIGSSELVLVAALAGALAFAWRMPSPSPPTAFLAKRPPVESIVTAEGGDATSERPATAETAGPQGPGSASVSPPAEPVDAAGRDAHEQIRTLIREKAAVDAAAKSALHASEQRIAELVAQLEKARTQAGASSGKTEQATAPEGNASARNGDARRASPAAGSDDDGQAQAQKADDTGRGSRHHRRLRVRLLEEHRVAALLQTENARLRSMVEQSGRDRAGSHQRDDALEAAGRQMKDLRAELQEAKARASGSAEAERAASARAETAASDLRSLSAEARASNVERMLLRVKVTRLTNAQRSAEAANLSMIAELDDAKSSAVHSAEAQRSVVERARFLQGELVDQRAQAEKRFAAMDASWKESDRRLHGALDVERIRSTELYSRALALRAVLAAVFRHQRDVDVETGLSSHHDEMERTRFTLGREDEDALVSLMTAAATGNAAVPRDAGCEHYSTANELATGRWRFLDGVLAVKSDQFRLDLPARSDEMARWPTGRHCLAVAAMR